MKRKYLPAAIILFILVITCSQDSPAFTDKADTLKAAIENDDLEAVKALVSADTDINQGEALAIAAKKGNIEIINALIKGSKDERVSKNVNVFELAETGTPIQFLEAVVMHNANFKVNFQYPGHHMVCDIDTGEELYEYKGKEYDFEAFYYMFTNPLFVAAAYNKNPESIKFLISIGLNPNEVADSGGTGLAYETVLSTALECGNITAVRELLNAGVRPEGNGSHEGKGAYRSPFELAAVLKDKAMAREIIDMLIKAGGNINDTIEADDGHDSEDKLQDIKTFKLIYSIGGEELVYYHQLIRFYRIHTPLVNVVIGDDPDAVNVLLDFNADTNIRDYLDKVALDYALELPKDSKLRNSPAFERLKKLTTAKTGLGLKVTHKGRLGIVQAKTLNIRAKPASKAKVNFQLHEREYVRIEKQQKINGQLWYCISNVDNLKGWALAKYILISAVD